MGNRKDKIKTNASENTLAFGTLNYVLVFIGLLFIIMGLVLMSGEGTTDIAFNPDIFSTMRIKIAPMICLTGFLFEIYAILK